MTAGVVLAAGVWDGLSARIASRSGFDALFVSGFAVAASLGLPDADLYSKEDTVRATRLARRCAPGATIISDMDDGYGNAVNVHYNVREFEHAGADAIFIEDQVAPKRCPLSVMDEPELISTDEAVSKIRAAVDGRANPETVIIARTDAGVADIPRRAEAYAAAGADVILPLAKDEAFGLEGWAALAASLDVPLAAFSASDTWLERELTLEVADQVGVRLIMQSLQGLYAAAHALTATYAGIRGGEIPDAVAKNLMRHGDFVELIGFPELEELQKTYIPEAN